MVKTQCSRELLPRIINYLYLTMVKTAVVMVVARDASEIQNEVLRTLLPFTVL